MRIVNHPRFWVDVPNILWDREYGALSRKYWKSDLFGFSGGIGGDEYGNRSFYISCALFNVVIFPDLCFQREVELPGPGAHPFIDAMYWSEERQGEVS
jgi:hypothetical protein